MSITKNILTILFLSALSTAAIAATEVAYIDGRVITGRISVHGKATLDEVVAELAKKAEAAGASAFKITSVSGNNQLHGNAVLLQ